MNKLDEVIITEITNIVTISSARGRYEKMHNRKYYGLSFCIDGQITYIQNNIKYVSDSRHAVLLPQGQSYTICGDKKGLFPLINFKCLYPLCDTIVVIPIENTNAFIKDFEQMKSLSLFESNRTRIMSIFYDMLHRLSAKKNMQTNILLPAENYIEDCYNHSDITNKNLADMCGISEVYFRKLFTKKHGITPHKYIINIRINKARQLLTDGFLKISAVSEKCGFSNPNHFCRLFKEKTGMTPAEYMNNNRIFKI